MVRKYIYIALLIKYNIKQKYRVFLIHIIYRTSYKPIFRYIWENILISDPFIEKKNLSLSRMYFVIEYVHCVQKCELTTDACITGIIRNDMSSKF